MNLNNLYKSDFASVEVIDILSVST